METRPERGEAEVHEVQRAVAPTPRAGCPSSRLTGFTSRCTTPARHRRQPRQRLGAIMSVVKRLSGPPALTAQDISSSDGPSRSITSTRLSRPEHALPAEVVHAREPRGTGVRAREHRAL